MTAPSGESVVDAIRAACERLSERLRFRQAGAIEPATATATVPHWWRAGMAGWRIFGDGLLALASPGGDDFSRAVTLFDGREISVSAGGESLPFAWIDGGINVAVVVTRAGESGLGPGPVYIGPPDGSHAAEPAAESLVAFLDRLQPQTLCLLAGPAGRRRIELCGERMVRIERAGRVHTRSFASDDEVGSFVGRFLSESIDDGLRVVSCPARMRPLVASYSGTVSRARDVPPEVRAQRVIEQLLAAEQLELIERVDIEQFIDDCARFLESENPVFRPSGRPSDKFTRRFLDWLLGHAAVDDLYVDDDGLAAAFELWRQS